MAKDITGKPDSSAALKNPSRFIVPFLLYLISGVAIMAWAGNTISRYVKTMTWVGVQATRTNLKDAFMRTKRGKMNKRVCSLSYGMYYVETKTVRNDVS